MAMLTHHLKIYIDTLGLTQAIEVLRLHGGRSFYLPENPTPGTAIAQALGYKLVCALQHWYPTATYQVPKADKVLMAVRDREIVTAIDEGRRVSDLCRQYQLTRQSIRRIYTDYEHQNLGPEQLDLF